MLQNAPDLAVEAVEDRRSHAVTRLTDERCRGCALSGSRICRAIREKSSASLHTPVIRRFVRGERIIEHGETSGFLAVIRLGFARRTINRLSGARIVMGLAIPGDIISELPGRVCGHDFEAATDIEICQYETATAKRQMATNQPFRRALQENLDDQYRRFLNLLWWNGALSSRERIIAFLVNAAEIMPTEPQPDGSIVLSMQTDRSDWADLTNTTVETICRTVRYLEEKRLITSLSPYRFQIHNLDALARLAGVDPPSMRMNNQTR